MHGVPDRVLLRHLLAEAGGSRREAARRAGVGRSTLYRWIADGLLEESLDTLHARYGPRPARAGRLTPFHPLIQARLGEFPELQATRLFAECRAAGYAGGYSQLRDYVRGLRPAPEPIVRFETAPGQQAQVDFAHCRLPWGVRYALIVVLGYSRLLWVRFFPRQDLRTLQRGLMECFESWGGVPHHLLFDQMKSILTRDDRLTGGGLLTNLECQRFAQHYGFRIRACRPYRAQTKGKVERPIRYLRGSFLYGRTFLSDADLNDQAAHWLDTVANPRVHGTTKAVPAERFRLEEQPALQALPARPYQSLVLGPIAPRPATPRTLPRIVVERRSLHAYAALAGADA
ncbi:MAG TPA: IS21 family transposase [Steroidobacteraceae bacterium]|jgi:transposase